MISSIFPETSISRCLLNTITLEDFIMLVSVTYYRHSIVETEGRNELNSAPMYSHLTLLNSVQIATVHLKAI